MMSNSERIKTIRALHKQCMAYLQSLYVEQRKILARVLQRKEKREQEALRQRIQQ